MFSTQLLKTKDLIEALELKNLLTVGEQLVRGVLMRASIVASYSRVYYPERDDANWLGAITVIKNDKRPMVQRLVLDPQWAGRAGDMVEDLWI